MKTPMLTLSLLGALALGSSLLVSQPVSAQVAPMLAASAAADPAQHVRDVVDALRRNDLPALVQAALPPQQYREAVDGWEKLRLSPTSEEDRAEFEAALQKWTAADTVDRVMAEIEPKLRERAVQSEGMVLMGLGAMHMAVNSPDSELDEEQRTMLKAALPGIENWVIATDFFDPATLRQALGLLVDAARGTGISSIDQIKMLSFDQALRRAGQMLTAGKQAVKLYGLDLDAIIASTRVELIEREGERARVRATVTAFNAPISTELELSLVEGRWYSSEALVHWTEKAERAERRRAAREARDAEAKDAAVEVEARG
jgi:PAS domain-containing protein